jgi:lysozyme family protein
MMKMIDVEDAWLTATQAFEKFKIGWQQQWEAEIVKSTIAMMASSVPQAGMDALPPEAIQDISDYLGG